MKIAALFVDSKGVYSGLDGVDIWDESRDARLYAGPHPVVAHPPCSRWCRFAGLVEARYGYRRREDGGCFEAALNAVRTYGGVLEHPASSAAWKAFDLNAPPSNGGWVNADYSGGWTCYVEQWRYGHRARKGTWLYAVHVDLPSMQWGYTSNIDDVTAITATVSTSRRIFGKSLPEITKKKERSATPIEFRDVLITMARSIDASRQVASVI